MSIKGVIFDLDGVIVSTDEYHYRGWKLLADDEGISFSKDDNLRLRGVSRTRSLQILLEKSEKKYTDSQFNEMAERKNHYYREMLCEITSIDILPGIKRILAELKKRGIKIAIGSSSKNSPKILELIGLDGFFDAEADGNDITKGKPDPEVFLLAAKRLSLTPNECLVIEDAEAGVSAAINGDMKVVAVGAADGDKRANFSAPNLSEVTVDQMLLL